MTAPTPRQQYLALISERINDANSRLLIEWLRDTNRKPAATAFTEGPERQLALAVESAIRVDRNDAELYRLLRASLGGDGCAPVSHVQMPVLSDPLNSAITYTARGLDMALGAIAAQMTKKAPT